MKKSAVKDHFVQLHSSLLKEVKESTYSYQEAADIDEDDTIDQEDFSHQNEANTMAKSLKRHQQEVAHNQRYLETLHTVPQDKIDVGALVQLNGFWLYISVPSRAFDFEGNRIHPISDKAPLYTSLEGKKVGDSVNIANEEKIILSIL